MADNSLQGGSDTIATDDIAGIKHQRVKVQFGDDGTAADASAANPLPTRITNGTSNTGVEPFGALMVNTGFTTLFYDSWSTSPIDTTDKWTVTGTAPTIANGNMQMPATLSTYNAIRTKDTVRPNAGFSLVRNGIAIEAAVATGAGRFWGLGTPATTPAPAVLAQDGIGFELDQATGALLAVTYAAGVRTTVATLTRPTDGLTHGLGVYFRVTQAYWQLDGVQVAAQSFPNLQVVELPALIVRQNAASFTGTPAFTHIAHLTADTSRQGGVLADPVIGTRMARVLVATAQPAATDGALLVNAVDTFAGTALASASRGVATVNTDIANYNGKGIRVWQDLTVLGATSVCAFSIQERDPTSGKYITLLASAAIGAGINSVGTAKLTVYPGLTAAANVVANDVVPVNIRIVSTVTAAASTFSIGYSIIP